MRPGAPGPEIFEKPELSADDIRGLENIAATAWPAVEREDLDGWMLRASPSPPRRVNSVFPNACTGTMSFPQRLAAAEEFYGARNRPPRFQVTRGSLPDELDHELEQRGYEIEAPVDIQISRAGEMAATDGAEGTIHVGDTLTPAWAEVYAAGFNRDVTAVIEQITGQPAFLTFQRGNDVLGVALGVYESMWLGIFGMQTRQSMRGQGIGSVMLKGLADWAVAQGALGLYLQVEQSNPRARALYERFGFRTVYAYHYRTLF